jgi:hypothetical protein
MCASAARKKGAEPAQITHTTRWPQIYRYKALLIGLLHKESQTVRLKRSSKTISFHVYPRKLQIFAPFCIDIGITMNASSSESSPKHELTAILEEALSLANIACQYDKLQNFVLACEYYDKALLCMDEVLNRLPPRSDEWAQLLQMRTEYDERMEKIRETESLNFNLAALTLGVSGKGEDKFRRKRLAFIDEARFDETNMQSPIFVPPDESDLRLPYWQLRAIKLSIEQGAFITSSIFLPQKVWAQSGVKISGLSAKSTAFQMIINVLAASSLETVPQIVNESSLKLIVPALVSIEVEYFELQNQLSKSFPFIKEIEVASKDEVGSVDAATSNKATTVIPCFAFVFNRFRSLFILTLFVAV